MSVIDDVLLFDINRYIVCNELEQYKLEKYEWLLTKKTVKRSVFLLSRRESGPDKSNAG